MPRVKRSVLTVKQLPTLPPGMHADGNGLYLSVKQNPKTGAISRSFSFRYWTGTARREKGLGPIRALSLEAARAEALRLQSMIKAGIDPLEQERVDAAETAKPKEVPTLRKCLHRYVEDYGKAWMPAHRNAWLTTPENHAAELMSRPVNAITKDDVVEVMRPKWAAGKSETMIRRAMEKLATVFDWAAANDLCDDNNPARLKGKMKFRLPTQTHVPSPRAALPWRKMPAFVELLRQRQCDEDTVYLLIEFTILTAARNSESREMRFTEIDWNEQVWTVPKDRMRKTDKPHRVPLSDRALEILEQMRDRRVNDYVFPGLGDRPCHEIKYPCAVAQRVAHRLDPGVCITLHGFRAAFSTWGREVTHYDRDMLHFALSHQLPDAVEAVYQRSDMVEKRRELMQHWADTCAGKIVVPFRGAAVAAE